jgi:pimeloyl-ACP methyl ester carboxylesterase
MRATALFVRKEMGGVGVASSSLQRRFRMRGSILSWVVIAAAAGVLGGCEMNASPSAETTSSTLMVAPQAGAATAAPAGEKYTYVVAHGAWAGGFEWKKVGEMLAKDGHLMYRPSHTGQGERSHLSSPDIDLNTHITDISNVILFENLRDVVLVGHSYGGMVITGVADRLPDRIKALVYVDAFLPNNGESLNTARPAPATAAGTQPARGRGRGGGQQVVNGMMGAAPRPGATPPYNVPQSAKTFSQPIELKNGELTKKIPVYYILTVDAGRQPEQDGFYFFSQRAKERGHTVVVMESDHVPSMTKPAELVKLLEEAPRAAKPWTTQ